MEPQYRVVRRRPSPWEAGWAVNMDLLLRATHLVNADSWRVNNPQRFYCHKTEGKMS